MSGSNILASLTDIQSNQLASADSSYSPLKFSYIRICFAAVETTSDLSDEGMKTERESEEVTKRWRR